MTDIPDERPGKGHNLPPIETPDEINERLGITYLTLIGRRDELSGMAARLPKAEEVDDGWEEKLSDGIKAAQQFIKSVEARRVDEKEPFMTAERAIDGFFKKISEPVDRLKNTMTAILSTYQRAKARKELEERQAAAREAARLQAIADEERRKAEAAARRKADDEEAQRRAAEARERATAAAEEAAIAERATKAKPAELSRSRSDLGVVSSLRTVWDFEVDDPAKVPRDYCSPDKTLIKAAIKSAIQDDGTCTLKIRGVRIFPMSASVTR